MDNKQIDPLKSPEEILTPLESEEWYNALIGICESIAKTTVNNARTEIIRGKWMLGNEILGSYELFERKKVYGEEIVTRVAESLRLRRIPISPREVWRCIQFTKKYPDLIKEDEIFLERFKEGLNISWSKIVKNYLPSLRKGPVAEECEHPESELKELSNLKCGMCGRYIVENISQTPNKENMRRKIETCLGQKEFPSLRLNQEGSPVPFVLSKRKDWKGYLENEHRSIQELWEVWKKIENTI